MVCAPICAPAPPKKGSEAESYQPWLSPLAVLVAKPRRDEQQGSSVTRLAPDDRVEVPLPRYTFQLGRATLLKANPRAGDEVLDGARHQDLARPCLLRHSGSDMDR